MFRRLCSFVLGAALAGPGPLAAQRYNFKFYGEEEGLQNLVVQVMLQDRAGFLWAGTENGLFRYDGSRFTSFGKADGLPAGRIESLHESVDGTLWIGTQLGLATLPAPPARLGLRFEPVGLGVARGVAGREAIASDADGHLYVATEHGLAVGTKSPKGWAFRLVGSVPGHPAEELVSAVYVDSTGAVWYGCGSALCRLKNGQVSESGEAEGLPADRWEAILEDLEGNIWVRSERQVAARSPATRRFQVRTGSGAAALPPANNTIPTLALDPDGKLLVPTSQGLARQTRSGWELIKADQGLTTNDISAVQQDREGSIWIGLLGSGLARWLGYEEWRGWNDHDGLSRESVWAAARDASGRLWVGTQSGLDYARRAERTVDLASRAFGERTRSPCLGVGRGGAMGGWNATQGSFDRGAKAGFRRIDAPGPSDGIGAGVRDRGGPYQRFDSPLDGGPGRKGLGRDPGRAVPQRRVVSAGRGESF